MGSLDLYSQDWCETVFESKNKEYGAYQDRKKSGMRHLRAIIIASSLFTLAIASPMIIDKIKPAQKDQVLDVTMLADIKVEETKKEENKVLEEIPPPPPELKSTIKFVPPKVTNDAESEEQMKTQEELQETKLQISIKDVEGTNDSTGVDVSELVDETKKITEEKEEEPLAIVEQMPDFPGGTEELLKYIGQNTKYPALARETEVQGVVYVNFVVERDGRISSVKVIRGIGAGCDEEAVRVVKTMPQWNPGRQNGKPVRVSFNIPIRFQLSK